MPTWLYQPHKTVLIGGVVQDSCFEWSSNSALDAVSSATLSLNYPLGAEVVNGASVDILAGAFENDSEQRVFSGRIVSIEASFSESGKMASITCAGWASVLDLPLDEELRFGGGAPTTSILLDATVAHIGDDTIAWYADTTADGLTVDYTFIPSTDARFVRVTGRLHGSNSFVEEPDSDIKTFSRIEIRQDGHLIGYTNLPVSSEQYLEEVDYTDDANWEDFDILVGCRVEEGDGEVTIRFTSGVKPGSTERDDYEIKGVTYATAGQSEATQIISSIFRNRGFGAAYNGIPYKIKRIKDIYGSPVELGGNGFIANGRVVVNERDSPWTWCTQAANLWGYHGVDGPDSVDILAVRGNPSNRTELLTLTEGVDILSIRTPSAISEAVTLWSVIGASGTDANGEPFQYSSRSAGEAVPTFVPDPPGNIYGELTSDLLVSDYLARTVRYVKEIETSEIPLRASLSILPTNELRPGDIVYVDAASVEVQRNMWVTSVRHVWSDSGWWTDIETLSSNGDTTDEEDPAHDPTTAPSTATRHVGSLDRLRFSRVEPDGDPVKYAFDPGGEYRAARVTGRIHGANSYISGSNPDVWSTVEIWQFETRVGTAHLPVSPERYSAQLDYTDNANWTRFDVTIAADIADGEAEVRFYAGSAIDASNDDYEVKYLQVELYTDANEQVPEPANSVDWQGYQARRRWRWSS